MEIFNVLEFKILSNRDLVTPVILKGYFLNLIGGQKPYYKFIFASNHKILAAWFKQSWTGGEIFICNQCFSEVDPSLFSSSPPHKTVRAITDLSLSGGPESNESSELDQATRNTASPIANEPLTSSSYIVSSAEHTGPTNQEATSIVSEAVHIQVEPIVSNISSDL